ncbi:T9SS type A sorting domain-containing protein [Lacibacter sediminis]|uniref:T9SS type A sorting domain-containing protein n=1 Tax=Lacibacter sediminis TaxID=2760713 RepID=A0A7G5XHB1_9BACT|nr:T9SS type A sorting domain-containing protein [Lacibacter sediminis]QNA44864.1 T9SS type A sorting domain-containing protein [Lacibacter sediminis]
MKKIICLLVFCSAVLLISAQVDVTNNGTLYITGNTDTISVIGNFTNASSASLTNNGLFYAKQNYTNNQASTPVGTGELTLNGTGAQYISTTSTSPFYKLTINKPSGLATLASAVTINNTLTFTAGKLSLDNYDMTMANSAAISGAGTNTYLIAVGSGVLKQQIAALGSKAFPVGTSAAYTPITISLAMFSTTDVFNVRMLPAVYVNGTTGNTMSSNSVNTTWMVSETVNGGSNASLTCQWPASLELTGFNRVFSRLAHYTSSAWDYGLMNIMASGSNPYTVTRAGFTSFSPFAVTMMMAILPTGTLEIIGKNKENENLINWSTSSEQSTAYFAVEASLNGTDFTEAGRVVAAGNSNNVSTYNFVHREINQHSYYYRIKQVDADGKITYSKTIRINVAALRAATLYPNPVKDKTTISFSLQQSSSITANIINVSGLLIKTIGQRYTKGDHKMHLDLSMLPAGSYNLQLKDDIGNVQTFQFIKTN